MAILAIGSSKTAEILEIFGIPVYDLKKFVEEFDSIVKKTKKNETTLLLVEDLVYERVVKFLEKKKVKNFLVLEIPLNKRINYKELAKKYLAYELNI